MLMVTPVCGLIVIVPSRSGVPPAAAIVIDNCFVLFPAELAALTVNVNAPAVVGVPEITPAAESVKPVGNVPPVTLHVIGVVPVVVTV